ncbi:MAG: hypothetical protein CMI54_06385 [Parcubacteria group bacterium]|jgi:hypothetical protein|nr:hypothetical protein [Parcubacteria group bacterium]|tara:strand:+ start:3517 stop:3726 length:210 start_codon:yes stop_codon:yes gene_type:complete
MPIPEEILNKIKDALAEAKEKQKEVKDVISDLKASGIDTLEQTNKLSELTEKIRQLETFYGRQNRRNTP